MVVTKEQLLAIMPNATKVVDKYLPVINKYSKEFGITTKQRMAFFLANVAHESGEMRYVVENMNYSAAGLVKVWPSRFSNKSGVAGKCHASNYAYKPEAIANVVYANRMGNGDKDSGDGWKYRGRGFFGLTGKDNYKAYQTYLRKGGMDVDLLANPELLEQPVGAVKSAMWFAMVCNRWADDNAFVAYSGQLNCGNARTPKDKIIGFESRRNYLARALKVL